MCMYVCRADYTSILVKGLFPGSGLVWEEAMNKASSHELSERTQQHPY